MIDLRDVVAAKNTRIARSIPRIVYRALELLLHVREINSGVRRYGELQGYSFVDAVRRSFDLSLEVEGRENLAETSRPIVASNHPLGGLDGIALMSVVGETHHHYVVPVNDFLMNIPNLRDIFVPINKHGANWRNFSRLLDVFSSDRAIVHFPAGLCSRRRGDTIRDLPWQKAFITKARNSRRTIVPTFVDGANSRRFYRIAQLRERTGWSFNAEMILLVDEMFRQRGKTLRIVFGPPISPDTFDGRCSDREWADILRRYVYTLLRRPRLSFHAFADAWLSRRGGANEGGGEIR